MANIYASSLIQPVQQDYNFLVLFPGELIKTGYVNFPFSLTASDTINRYFFQGNLKKASAFKRIISNKNTGLFNVRSIFLLF